MKHIDHFNKSIKKMYEQMPTDITLGVIEKYRRTWNYLDYYQTLDRLGFKLGIEYVVQQVFNEDEGEVSFVPSIKLQKDNPLNGQFEVIELREFKSVAKAYSYIAKEFVYRLMNIRDLENCITSR